MDRATVTAVLGPTNTGKTHLAVERLCAHSSGIMGFPLRLLAREVYDRVVRIKGPKEVGLLTGEEKILPDGARWLLCTAESMPSRPDAAFVALDEVQLGGDPERGHVFTDRLLHARGREETMLLGSESLAGLVRALVPGVDIVKRPRFSTLSYAGAKKLSRLPKRSAIVAFSAEEVYAVAEMLRRTRGGAAVVMGALSPRTRNAQVAMFQSGEVDYLVATDAIGMGLNMDVAHVAFASLSKFDGRRQRRLTVAELAQIAGRAGRHQRDGTFGTLGSDDGPNLLTPEEVEAIEEHRFPRLEQLYWRNSQLDFTSIETLLGSLERKPEHGGLRAAPEAVDLAVLRRLTADPATANRARGQRLVARLWEACGLPDFRKTGPEHHSRLVARVFGHLSEGHIPDRWIAEEIARLDRVDGDVDALGGRIAAARTWAYVAHRADWLRDPHHWTGVSEALEQKLSDALHKKLTERFVDRRTSVLLREIGADPALLDVTIGEDGTVSIEDEVIGRLDGFRFTVDPLARSGDRKRLLAAAERRLGKERGRRAEALLTSEDGSFGWNEQAELQWRGEVVARLTSGRHLIEPAIQLDRSLDPLPASTRTAIAARLQGWLHRQFDRRLAPLVAMRRAADAAVTPPQVRALLAPLVAAGGSAPRVEVETALNLITSEERGRLRAAGLTIGTFDVFDARLLKPGAAQLLALLQRARGLQTPLAPPGASVSDVRAQGFRQFGEQWVRLDVVEKIVRALHERRSDEGFVPDPALAVSIGLKPESFTALLKAAGFTCDTAGTWRWRHRTARTARAATPGNPFGALANWGAAA